MDLESVREYCLSLPHTTEMVQWVNQLLFKVGGKMFAMASLEPEESVLLFKTSPEDFYGLQEIEGFSPAPYLARAQWVAMERWDVLRDDELRHYLAEAHRLVYEKLPKKTKLELEQGTKPKKVTAKRKTAAKRKK